MAGKDSVGDTIRSDKEMGRQTMEWVRITEVSLTTGHDEGKDNTISCKQEGGELTTMKQ